MNLKRCPFCGSEDVWYEESYEYPPEIGAYVRCRNCEAQGPYAKSEKLSVEIWNTRAGETNDIE